MNCKTCGCKLSRMESIEDRAWTGPVLCPALTAIFSRLRWAERAEAFLKEVIAEPDGHTSTAEFYRRHRSAARELLNQLEKEMETPDEPTSV